MATVGQSDVLNRHWRDFSALRSAFRKNEIIIGVDRSFALSQILGSGTAFPFGQRVTAWGLLAALVIVVAAAAFALWSAMYLLCALCAPAAWLLWLFLVKFAIRAAREAALRDERLFRRWFTDLRLSIYIKSSGEYVWNNTGGPHQG